MNEITVKVDSRAAQEAYRRSPSIMRKHIGDSVWRGALEVSREARRLAPKAFSTLTNSILPSRVTDLHAQVNHGVNYGNEVETGRGKGKQAGTSSGLMEWVRLKIGLQGKELDRATFAIARAIGRRGIKPQPYMAPAAMNKESRVFDLVRQGVDRGCAEILA